MRPLFRSLFVFSIFGVLAAHVSTGVLRKVFGSTFPDVVPVIDHGLDAVLLGTFDARTSICVLLGVGAALALYTYLDARATARSRGSERFSTW